MKYLVYLLFFLLLLPTTSATIVKFEPATLNIKAGTQESVVITVIPTEAIDTVATDYIYWDASIVDCTGIQRGNLFNDTTIWIPGTINNDKGEIRKMVWASIYPTNESGTFITLIFTGKKNGNTKITINETDCGIARAGVDIKKTLQGICTATVYGESSSLPVVYNGISIYVYLVIFIFIFMIILILFFLLMRRKKKEKPQEEPEEKTIEDIDDNIF